MPKTKIEWTEYSWNPVTGCTPISEGCQNCYARRMAKRLRGRCGYPKDEPFRVTLHPERLDEPLKWKKPRRVFVCSMSDLFHEDVPYEFIYDIWDVMVKNRQHTFLILSKRPDRMKSFIERVMANRMDYAYTLGNTPEGKEAKKWAQRPIQNIWLGVTAENQEQADKRIPILLQIPAAVRFISVEPMLGEIDLTRIHYEEPYSGTNYIDCLAGTHEFTSAPYGDRKIIPCERIDWVICGGETGPGARPMHPDWVRSLRDQCQEAGVPFFFKQWGEFEYLRQGAKNGDGKIVAHKIGKKRAGRLLDGREWNEFPEVRICNQNK